MITPQQARDTIDQDDRDTIARMEAQIDQRLKNYYDRPIRFDIPQGCSRRIVDKLVAMYRRGGWIVEPGESCDQRDPGTWLDFAAPRGSAAKEDR